MSRRQFFLQEIISFRRLSQVECYGGMGWSYHLIKMTYFFLVTRLLISESVREEAFGKGTRSELLKNVIILKEINPEILASKSSPLFVKHPSKFAFIKRHCVFNLCSKYCVSSTKLTVVLTLCTWCVFHVFGCALSVYHLSSHWVRVCLLWV